jgi:hypothetical protein
MWLRNWPARINERPAMGSSASRSDRAAMAAADSARAIELLDDKGARLA